MIRISTKLFWYHEKPDFLDWLFSNPKGWNVSYGKIRWGPYTDEEYSKKLRKQAKSPVCIGQYGSKYFWWFRDDFIVCDEDFEEDVIVGWYVKRQALKQAKLEKYKELGKVDQSKAKSKSTPRKEKAINREALALGLSKIGFKKTEAYKAICHISDEHPEVTEETLVKEAIKTLHKQKS